MRQFNLFRNICLVLVLGALSFSGALGVASGQASADRKLASHDGKALRTIGFMTDFDVRDDAVGICKAVMNGVAPGVQIIDITHQATPYDIAEGARFLAGSAPYFPMMRCLWW